MLKKARARETLKAANETRQDVDPDFDQGEEPDETRTSTSASIHHRRPTGSRSRFGDELEPHPMHFEHAQRAAEPPLSSEMAARADAAMWHFP